MAGPNLSLSEVGRLSGKKGCDPVQVGHCGLPIYFPDWFLARIHLD
jgi:hypothetical protein